MSLTLYCLFLTLDSLYDALESSSFMSIAMIEVEGGYGIELNLSGASQRIRVIDDKEQSVFTLERAQALIIEISELRHHLYGQRKSRTDPSTMTVPLV